MGDSFTIQISHSLLKQLAEEDDQFKKKTRKPKPKTPKSKPKPKPDPTRIHNDPNPQFERPGGGGNGWSLPPPLYLPVPPPEYSASAELAAIRSVLQESEKVVEKLEKREKEMGVEVSQRAKDLHEKEFKIPERKPMPCLAEKDSCLDCYKQNLNDPLKCADLVKGFADCARRARQVMNLNADK